MDEPELKITRGDIIARGVLCHCPNCGKRGLLASWFRLNKACHACGLDLAAAQELASLHAALSVTSPHTIHPGITRRMLRELAAGRSIPPALETLLAE